MPWLTRPTDLYCSVGPDHVADVEPSLSLWVVARGRAAAGAAAAAAVAAVAG